MNKLKEVRRRCKKTQQEVADYLSVDRSTVTKWETGKHDPDNENLLKLAVYYGATIDELLGVAPVKGVRVPIYGSVPAGIPLEAIENIEGYEEITPALASNGEYFALRIKGDSMAPRICDGDIVIIKKETAVDSGDIAIVLVDGNEATCKEVRLSNAGLTLVGWNVAAFSPMFYTKEEVETLPVRIVGRVVEVRIKNLKHK